MHPEEEVARVWAIYAQTLLEELTKLCQDPIHTQQLNDITVFINTGEWRDWNREEDENRIDLTLPEGYDSPG